MVDEEVAFPRASRPLIALFHCKRILVTQDKIHDTPGARILMATSSSTTSWSPFSAGEGYSLNCNLSKRFFILRGGDAIDREEGAVEASDAAKARLVRDLGDAHILILQKIRRVRATLIMQIIMKSYARIFREYLTHRHGMCAYRMRDGIKVDILCIVRLDIVYYL